MSLIVGVHGIAQQFKGEHVLRAEWTPPLQDGLRRAGELGEAALRVLGDAGLHCAFYGDLFRPPGRPLAVGDPFLTAEDVTDYDAELLHSWWEAAAEADPEVVSPDARSLGPRNVVQAALRALSASKFFAGVAGKALIFDLVQVRRYFTEPEIRQAVRARVEAAVDQDTRVIVAHSLGTVVAYEALCAHPEWQIDLFLTVGSPLGIRNLIFDRLEPAPILDPAAQSSRGRWPESVQSWTNVADVNDVVALVKDFRPLFDRGPRPEAFNGFLVDNGAHAHDVSPYLTSREAGQAIATALAPNAPRSLA